MVKSCVSKLGMALLLTAPLASSAFGADKIASVEVSIDDAVAKKSAAGIRTLFITVFDADSPRPMPYGSMKVDLKADAKGVIYKGDLDSTNVKVMMEGAPAPKNIRIKARLDKDGSAGPDSAGDITGTVNSVKAGETAKIKIDKAV